MDVDNANTYMLYTSGNSSLAYLENLVHFEEANIPPNLYVVKIELQVENALIYNLPDKAYPKDWQILDNLENKILGDRLMSEQKYLALKVRSVVNPSEYNYLLNPLFLEYHKLIRIVSAEKLNIDIRLVKI